MRRVYEILMLVFCLHACAPFVPATPVSPSIPSPTDDTTLSQDQPSLCTQVGQHWVSLVDGVTLVCVPVGEFFMGADESDPNAQPHEKPQHQIYLDAFWMDRTEATNENFQKCVAAGICKPRPARRGTTGVASRRHLNYYYDPLFANYPVLIYTPDDAVTYCRWAGRRLPTEAEWEKAARGTDIRIFPWGDELDCSRASFSGCTEDTTNVEEPTAGASAYGALNMAGNVWEWVADWYAADYYSNSPNKNPTGPTTGEYKVRRGGGWSSLSRNLRSTTRESGSAHHYFDGQMGFRCALSDAAPQDELDPKTE